MIHKLLLLAWIQAQKNLWILKRTTVEHYNLKPSSDDVPYSLCLLAQLPFYPKQDLATACLIVCSKSHQPALLILLFPLWSLDREGIYCMGFLEVERWNVTFPVSPIPFTSIPCINLYICRWVNRQGEPFACGIQQKGWRRDNKEKENDQETMCFKELCGQL